MLRWLVLFHVLSAIIGVGPAFFVHVLLRRNQTLDELNASLQLAKKLEYFPKIGGTLAVLSGFALYFVGNYGSFQQLWLLGSLVLYIAIQVIVIGFVTPRQKKLGESVSAATGSTLTQEQQMLLKNVNMLFYVVSTLGILLFIFMIMKP
jgi:uncharacterized membrane protein